MAHKLTPMSIINALSNLNSHAAKKIGRAPTWRELLFLNKGTSRLPHQIGHKILSYVVGQATLQDEDYIWDLASHDNKHRGWGLQVKIFKALPPDYPRDNCLMFLRTHIFLDPSLGVICSPKRAWANIGDPKSGVTAPPAVIESACDVLCRSFNTIAIGLSPTSDSRRRLALTPPAQEIEAGLIFLTRSRRT
jgi:hypothetical protein